MQRIVVDAMGGDHAPDEIVRGAAEATLALPTTEIILVGDSARIGRILPEVRHDGGRIRVHHTSSWIAMEESPTEAIASRPDASITVAAELVARGEGDALVSAGNTGASLLACTRAWPCIAGVHRPALAAVYPTELRHGDKNDPFSLVLDVGAAIDASAEDLVVFALMGSTYAKIVSRNDRPRVALLSTGSESSTGPQAVARAHDLLLQGTDINFIGSIEGLDIPRGVADVVVCSGFVGNVVIKMLEGVGDTVLGMARYATKERLLWRVALAMLSTGIERLKDLTDWEQYGGAPLLGLAHPLIKAHGHSRRRAVENAIRVADKAVRARLCDTIAASLASVGES